MEVPKVLPKVMSEWKGLRRPKEGARVLAPAFVDGIFWGGFLYFFYIIKAFGSNINVFALSC